MPKLTRRISVTALSTDGVGTRINTAASVGGLVVPQQQVCAIWLRQLGAVDIEWRAPAQGSLVNAKLTIPAKEVGLLEGVSTPQEVELFLPVGVSTATEVQIVIEYVGALS